jgi:hypothetical protein
MVDDQEIILEKIRQIRRMVPVEPMDAICLQERLFQVEWLDISSHEYFNLSERAKDAKEETLDVIQGLLDKRLRLDEEETRVRPESDKKMLLEFAKNLGKLIPPPVSTEGGIRIAELIGVMIGKIQAYIRLETGKM